MVGEVRERIDLGVALRRLPRALRDEAAAELVKMLEEPRIDAWSYAPRYLVYLGPWPEGAYRAFETHLRSPDRELREAAAMFLGGDRRGMRGLVEVLEKGNRAERDTVIDRLFKRPGPWIGLAVPALERLIEDPGHSKMALIALAASRARSPKGAPAAMALIRAEPDPLKKADLFISLEGLFRGDEDGLDELAGNLIDAVRKPDAGHAWTLVRALGLLGKRSAPAAPALVALLAARGPRSNFRSYDVADALGRIGAGGEAAVPALIALFDGEDASAKHQALSAMAGFGSRGLPKLIEVARSEGSPYRGTTRSAIRRIAADDPAAVPLLVPLLGEKGIAEDAAVALGRLRAEEPLLAALRAPEAWKRLDALRGLREIGDRLTGTALEEIVGRFEDPDETVRRVLLRSLAPAGDRAFPPIERALSGSDPALRIGAAETLGMVRGGRDRAMAVLEDLLDDREPGVRSAAAGSLGRLGGLEEGTVARLLKMMDEDPDLGVRGSLIRVLCTGGPIR